MKRTGHAFTVGLFLIAGTVCFSYLASMLGDATWFDDPRYHLRARFVSASGLRAGADVELAGVAVGKVETVIFDPGEFQAVVEFSLPESIRIPDDAIASVRSTGIIGGKFLKITPGGSERFLVPGDEILETESSISLEELISRYIFQSSDQGSAARGSQPALSGK